LVFPHPLFLVCDQPILNFLFLISKFISSWPVAFHKSLLAIIFGHHILRMFIRHRLTKVSVLRRVSLVTSRVSHSYNSTDFMQTLKILILVSFHIGLVNHTFLNLENDPLAQGSSTFQIVRATLTISMMPAGHKAIHDVDVHIIGKSGRSINLTTNRYIMCRRAGLGFVVIFSKRPAGHALKTPALALCILTLTYVLAPPSSATPLPK
jgi:hypothetical protein